MNSRKRQRVQLIRPPQGYVFLDTHYPIGLGVLGERLRQAGHDVRGTLLSRTAETIARADWYLISATTPSFPAALEVARRLRTEHPRARIVVGGPHASALPEEVSLEGAFDHVVVGEADEVIAPLVNGLFADRIIRCELPKDIDTIPCRDLFPAPALQVAGKPAANVMLTRGCPYRCRFCASAGIPHRRRHSESVRDEFRLLTRLGYRALVLNDDTPTLTDEDLNVLCELICEAGFSFRMNLRADFVSDERLRILKESGCVQVNIGVEIPSDQILKTIDKRLSVEQISNAFALAKRHDLSTKALLIHGLPGTGIKEAADMVRFVKKVRPDFVTLSSFMPIPGSVFWADFQSLSVSPDRLVYHGKTGDSFDVEHFPNGILSSGQLAWLKKWVGRQIEAAGIYLDHGEASHLKRETRQIPNSAIHPFAGANLARLVAISLPVLKGFQRIEPREWGLSGILLELGTEVGSLGRCLTVWEEYRHGRMSRHDLADELSDILFVLIRLAHRLGCALDDELDGMPAHSPEVAFHELMAGTTSLYQALIPTSAEEEYVKVLIESMAARILGLADHYRICLEFAHEEEMRLALWWQRLFYGHDGMRWGFGALVRKILWYFHLHRHRAILDKHTDSARKD